MNLDTVWTTVVLALTNWKVVLAMAASVPAIIKALSMILIFINEYIRHGKVKNIERALQIVTSGSAEQQILIECRNEELLRINTGLTLSSIERTRISKWLTDHPVTIGLIRTARPLISWEEGIFEPRLKCCDVLYIYYASAMSTFLAVAGFFLFVLGTRSALSGDYHLILTGIFAIVCAVLVLVTAKSQFQARTLVRLLKMQILP